MTGDRARVAAVWTRQGAGLLAAAFCQAVAPVAHPFAAVHFAWQQFIAGQAAGNVLQMTGDVAALLWVEGKKKKSPVSARGSETEQGGNSKGQLPRASPCTTSGSGRCRADTSPRCGSCETLNQRQTLNVNVIWSQRATAWTGVVVCLTWVVALVPPRAQVFALWGLGAAGDGRVQHGEPAVTRQLIETYKTEGIMGRCLSAAAATS